MFKKLFEKKIDFKKLYAEYPPGIRYCLLLHYDTKQLQLEELKALRDAYSAIENIIVDRNLQGSEFEKSGRLEHAIQIYELNVADQVDTPHPYDRLRILYTKNKQYDNAIRVCQAWINASKARAKALRKPYDNKVDQAYITWISKLEEKRSKEIPAL